MTRNHDLKRNSVKNFIIVSNWKMQLSYRAALAYLATLTSELGNQTGNSSLIFCPSFDVLSDAHKILQSTDFYLGAQDCSAHSSGPFTGQVQAESLAQLGCRYSIIGHNEMRLQGQTPQAIAQKMNQLRANNIIPIICVGESAEDKHNAKSHEALETHIKPLIDELNTNAHCNDPLVIAYEPVWAIGTQVTPTPDYISSQLAFVKKLFKEVTNPIKIQTIYGGSVDENSVASLLKIPELDGILLGKASLDSQKFKKIVRSCISITKN